MIATQGDPHGRSAVLRFGPTTIIAASLLVLAGFLDGNARIAAWVVALAIDYSGPGVIGMGHGWRVAPTHFAERYGLIVLIALGESVIAIGTGAGFELGARELVAAGLGIVVIAALWWLYFDVAALLARRRLADTTGLALARRARDAYSYLHLPIVAGVVLFAFGLEATLAHPDEALNTLPALALCGGTALYLLGHVAFLFRMTRYLFRRRTIGAVVLLSLTAVAVAVPALTALTLVAATCSLVVAYEAIAHRQDRIRVRRSTERSPT